MKNGILITLKYNTIDFFFRCNNVIDLSRQVREETIKHATILRLTKKSMNI